MSPCGAVNRPVRGLRRDPNASSTTCGASAAHSPIASTEFDPANTAAAAIAITAATECRIPRRFRGSGTRVNSSSSRPQSAGSTCRSQLVAAAEDNTANMPDWAGNGAPEEVRILDDRHS